MVPQDDAADILALAARLVAATDKKRATNAKEILGG